MKHTLLIILLGLSLPGIGQKTCTDLQTVLGEIRAKRRAEAYKDALALAQQTLPKAILAKCISIVGSSYNEIGICQQELQQYEQADTAFKTALKVRRSLGDVRGEANVYQNLMSLKISAGHSIAADEYGKKALSTFEKISDFLGMARVYNEYSNFFADQNDPRALEYNLKSLDLAERAKNDTLIAENCLNLGNRYSDTSRYDSAEIYFKRTLSLAERLHRPRLKGQALNGLGISLWGLELLKDAEDNFLKALNAYRRGEDDLEISYTYNNLAQIYEQQKDFGRAKAMIDSADAVLDTVFTQKILREKKDLAFYESLIAIRSEKESLLVDQSIKQRWITLLIVGCVFFVLFILYLRQRMKNQRLQHANVLARKENERLLYENQLIEQQKKQFEMEAMLEQQQQNIDNMVQNHQQEYMKERLKAEIRTRKNLGQQLHNNIGGHLIALRNRMENMLSLLQEEPQLENRIRTEVSTITEIHEEARRLSRTIEKSELDTTWLEDLKRFCSIHNNAHNAKPQMYLILNNMGEPLPTRIAETLYSIAMALIGNTLKWANANRLEIQVSNTGNEVSLVVMDDGIGFDENQVEKGQGLHNLYEQVAEIGGEVYIDSDTDGRGSEFIISVPLKNELPNYNTD